jgi:hypothetical protein
MNNLAYFFLSTMLLMACEPDIRPQQIPRIASNQIEKVRFQQILVSFKEVDAKQSRTKEQAQKLAEKLFSETQNNPSLFIDYVRQYSADPFPAVYTLVNFGQTAGEGERERDEFAPGIALTIFELKMGEVALIPYDEETCPAGYHLVMRLPL